MGMANNSISKCYVQQPDVLVDLAAFANSFAREYLY